MDLYLDFNAPFPRPYKHVPPTLGELIEDGFEPFAVDDWNDLGWYQTDAEKKESTFTSDQQKRFETKFLRRYKPRAIGLYPPEVWRDEMVRILGEVLPKYKTLFKLLDQGIDPLSVKDTYGKNRSVYSVFPATQIDASKNDYARDARDNEFETFELGDFINKVLELAKDYRDADALLLNELEGTFDSVLTTPDNWYTWPPAKPVID